MSTHNIESAQNTFAFPYGLLVARGNIPRMSHADVYGYNPNVSTNYETIWDVDGTYAYPGSAVAMTVTSASGATDSGVKVTIEGLDTNWLVISEQVTLNASGTATTTSNFLRINAAYVSGNTEPAGNITIANGGTTYAQITYPYNKALALHYSVPANMRAYVISAFIGVEKNQDLVSKVMVRYFGGVFIAAGIISTFGTPFSKEWSIPTILPPKTDIEIRAKAGATTSVAGNIHLLLETVK